MARDGVEREDRAVVVAVVDLLHALGEVGVDFVALRQRHRRQTGQAQDEEGHQKLAPHSRLLGLDESGLRIRQPGGALKLRREAGEAAAFRYTCHPMAAKRKQPSRRKASAGPAWQIILEEMRSQNRATLEAVETARAALEERIDRLDRESRDRDIALEAALRVDVQKNSTHTKQLQGDVRGLAATLDSLVSIEQRVSALEKRRSAG